MPVTRPQFGNEPSTASKEHAQNTAKLQITYNSVFMEHRPRRSIRLLEQVRHAPAEQGAEEQQPYAGFIQVSSDPLRAALAQLGQ